MVRPLRSAGIQSAFGHAHARGRAVPGEDHVAVEIDLSPDRAARRRRASMLAHVGELQLLDDVGDPAVAEALPGEHVDAALRRAATTAPSRPRRCRRPARCRCGSRPAPAGLRGSASIACFELGLADLGAMRAAERGVVRAPRATSRDAWRRDRRRNWDLPAARPGLARSSSSWSILPDSCPSLGRGGPRTAICVHGCGVKRKVYVAAGHSVAAAKTVLEKTNGGSEGPPLDHSLTIAAVYQRS